MDIASVKTFLDFSLLFPRRPWSFTNVDRKEMFSFSHAYHRYPAKFVPHIVKKLIASYAPTDTVVISDIFGGCGTTLVEAKLSGYESIGYDINPVAALITRVKTTPIDPVILDESKSKFLKYYAKTKETKIAHHDRISYWFDSRTVKKLNRIFLSILKIKDRKIREFYLVAFSQNLKTSSRWLMSSIKPTIDPSKKPAAPYKSFMKHLDFMIKKNLEFHEALVSSGRLDVPARMLERDATKKLPVSEGYIDLIITSPPYVTSYEYGDLHQLSLLWFASRKKAFSGWKKHTSDLTEFRKRFIGTSFKKKRKKIPGSSLANSIVSDLEKADRPLANNVANYFCDIHKAFTQAKRALRQGGRICVIVGNTELRGVEILNAQVAIQQLYSLGFKKIDIIKREVANKVIAPWRDKGSGKFTGTENPNKKRIYQFEYVLVLEKVG